jgi:hypothetical protein
MIDPGRVQHAGRGGKMAEAIELEKVDEHGKPVKRLMACQPRKPGSWHCKGNLTNLRRKLHLSLAKGNPK